MDLTLKPWERVSLYLYFAPGRSTGWPVDKPRNMRVPFATVEHALEWFPAVTRGEARHVTGEEVVPDTALLVIENRPYPVITPAEGRLGAFTLAAFRRSS